MGLYAECKQYLVDRLKAAGVKTKPYTSQKALAKSLESHVSAVIFETENPSRNGSKKFYRDKEGAKKKRRKIFDRPITFTVTIGDYTDDAVETIYEAFLEKLERGIWVDGNFVPIEVDGVDWFGKEDSILKAQVTVQVAVTFQGGLYRDTDFGPLTHVEIETIEKANGKEPIHGK